VEALLRAEGVHAAPIGRVTDAQEKKILVA
jgi:hypothetical protein